MFKEFEEFDDACRKHLGCEPYAGGRKVIRDEKMKDRGPVHIVHNLENFPQNKVAEFLNAIKPLKHVKIVTFGEPAQIIPRRLFFGDLKGAPMRADPSSVTEKNIYQWRPSMQEVAEKISKHELKLAVEGKLKENN